MPRNIVNATEAVLVFEFSEDGIGVETPPKGPDRKSDLGSVMGNNSFPIPDF